jgi:hypothetical protein
MRTEESIPQPVNIALRDRKRPWRVVQQELVVEKMSTGSLSDLLSDNSSQFATISTHFQQLAAEFNELQTSSMT